MMLDKLNQVLFHDSSLLQLKIDFDKFVIEIELENEETKRITFFEITSLRMDELNELNPLDSIEIYGAEFNFVEDKYTAKFFFLLGFGNPSWELEFSFKDAEIN